MGFPAACHEVVLPKFILRILSVLSSIRTAIFTLFRFMGLSDLLEPDDNFFNHQDSDLNGTRMINPPISAVLSREFLPVIKFNDLPPTVTSGERPDCCAVCLNEFEGLEEIRCLTNCKHFFHRRCLDRWMDHAQTTCPLCRTPFLSHDEYKKRLRAAASLSDLYGQDLIIPGS